VEEVQFVHIINKRHFVDNAKEVKFVFTIKIKEDVRNVMVHCYVNLHGVKHTLIQNMKDIVCFVL